jgi:hypothetical protein
MTDPYGRAEILSGGPGGPVPAARDAGRLDLDLDEPERDAAPDEPAYRPWRAALSGVLSAPSLALTGLVLAFLPFLGLSALMRLASALGSPDELPADGGAPDRDPMVTAMTGVSAGTALLGVACGMVALRRAEPADRTFRGIAGAAVLLGLFGALVHLVVSAVGGPDDGFFY